MKLLTIYIIKLAIKLYLQICSLIAQGSPPPLPPLVARLHQRNVKMKILVFFLIWDWDGKG